ncbi:MAG: flavodoxin domain-containing protein [Candidatus Bathyarchaeia archaeon]
MKVFIIYDSKYGNTKIAAENILEGVKQVEGIEAEISYVKEIDSQSVVNYDVLILGAPNHMANSSRTMKKFVVKLVELDLKTKKVAIFGTYSGRIRTTDRAVKKLEKIVEKTLPNLKLLPPSLSVRVKGVTGPVEDGELTKCKEFGTRIANQLNP